MGALRTLAHLNGHFSSPRAAHLCQRFALNLFIPNVALYHPRKTVDHSAYVLITCNEECCRLHPARVFRLSVVPKYQTRYVKSTNSKVENQFECAPKHLPTIEIKAGVA